MSYFVYIIYSPSKDKYYVGQTENVDQRLEDHRNSRSGYTKGVKDWELKWSYKCYSRSESVGIEAKIKKKKGRRYIEYLINGGTLS